MHKSERQSLRFAPLTLKDKRHELVFPDFFDIESIN